MIHFTFALLRPVFGVHLVVGDGADALTLAQYRAGFQPRLVGILIALGLAFFLMEAGPAARKPGA